MLGGEHRWSDSMSLQLQNYKHISSLIFAVLSSCAVCSRQCCVTIAGWHSGYGSWWNVRCLPRCWSDYAEVTWRSV